MKILKSTLVYFLSLILLMGCSKEDEGPQFGKLEIKFENVVGTTKPSTTIEASNRLMTSIAFNF